MMDRQKLNSHLREDSHYGTSRGLAAATLLVAALQLAPHANGLDITFTGRVVAVALALWAVLRYARRLNSNDWQAWLWESWRFVKQIFLLLVVGVFAVGVIRQLIEPEWIKALAGRNTLLANAVAVIFGVFMYFPTLVEVPVARMFLDLGMHPGPLLAYLMADPELSLQSILMVAAVIGRAAWVDGVGPFWLALGLVAFAAALAAALAWLHRRQQNAVQAS